MMKKLTGILLLGIALTACKQAANKKPEIANADSIKMDTDVVPGPIDPNPPPMPLPFGPAGATAKNFYKKDPWFYYKLIGEGYTLQHDQFTAFTQTYPLPPTEKYTHAKDDFARDFCLLDEDHQIPVDSLFTIKNFRQRLPDHEGFEVYYATGDAAVDTLFPEVFKGCEMNYKLYGYLIFYERATKTAHLLPAFYHWYGESDHAREFYIDSNYRIFMYTEHMYEGEKGKADIDAGPVCEVTINPKGGFTIKPLKK